MAEKKQKLELTWIGKGDDPKLEPRILIEDPEKSYGDPTSGNMLIHGDNLLALKALEQDFAGKIKCIYIDPPYNTGNAFEHYDDAVEHSIWLNLMRPRMEILCNLLSDEGTLWATLDDNEGQYFKILCDEIFGRNNFVGTVVWNSRKSKQNDTHLSLSHNYNFVYAKDLSKMLMNRLPVNDERFANPDNDPRGEWAADPMDAPNIRPNLTYAITNPNTGLEYWPPQGRHWRTTENNFLAALADNRIIWGKTGKSKPQLKRFKSDAEEKGETPGTWWDDVGTATEAKQEIQKLFSRDNLFDTPKPEKLIQRILSLGSNEGDFVLDSFLGSGTTSAVAHKMGRKYIGIEMGEHVTTHCLPRLQKVVDGSDGLPLSETLEWKGGGGFKFYDLAPSLLKQDAHGNWIIDEKYNANMLAAAMAKQEGFHFVPDEQVFWKQARSTEKDFLFTTTQFLTTEMLDTIHEEMSPEESLLIACKAYHDDCAGKYLNITVKKIPQILLGRCEFGKDDYSLNIVNVPVDTDEEIEEELVAPKKKRAAKSVKKKAASAQRALI